MKSSSGSCVFKKKTSIAVAVSNTTDSTATHCSLNIALVALAALELCSMRRVSKRQFKFNNTCAELIVDWLSSTLAVHSSFDTTCYGHFRGI
jgi:hypothetical protein